MKNWQIDCCCNCCSNGPLTCLYVWFCGCCAAGDVAQAAGKDYCCTCCVIPFFCPCITPCYLNGDRAALAARYNINDPLGGCNACCLFYLGCGMCLLVQELAEIEYQKTKGGSTSVTVTNVTAPPQQAMAPMREFFYIAGVTVGANSTLTPCTPHTHTTPTALTFQLVTPPSPATIPNSPATLPSTHLSSLGTHHSTHLSSLGTHLPKQCRQEKKPLG